MKVWPSRAAGGAIGDESNSEPHQNCGVGLGPSPEGLPLNLFLLISRGPTSRTPGVVDKRLEPQWLLRARHFRDPGSTHDACKANKEPGSGAS